MQKSEQFPDIDSRINWLDFYSPYLKNPRSCGKDKMHACCPFHEERHPSFWFNTKNGCFKCEGCGESGNATVFLSKIKGIDQKDAYKELLELAGIDPNKQSAKPQKKSLPDYSTAIYGAEKCFTSEWLKDECKISDGTDQSGKFIKIPYMDADGNIVATRKRYCPSNPNGKFKWQKGSTLRLYGLWRKLSEDFVILIEGESDSQSLWVLGFPAYGVPGATNFQTKWVDDLKDIPKIYLHIEPDKGGQTFRQQMISKLYEGGYQGEVYTFNLGECNVKDPSELYCRDGVDATDEIWAAIALAERVDLQSEAENLPELVAGMPVLLKEPEGWKLSDDGIFKYEARTEQYKRVCRTPIIIVKRLRNIETDEEKIQVAFKIRGHWKFGIFPSTTIYQSRNIVSLADLGALITSENSKQVVSFLEALESENIERIKEAKSVSQLGWATDENFLPEFGKNIELDTDQSMKYYINALTRPSGSLEQWCEIMREHRKRNKFRFVLSSAFVPMLFDKVLKGRNMLVYLWANSVAGKTAALKAALSVYGDPETLMLSFNSTQVGFERTMTLFNNIIVGIDERQIVGSSTSWGQDFVEKVTYMAGNGRGKQRGTKNGGLQAACAWSNWVIATGEEPIVQNCTKDGVSSRVIEVYGKQFSDEKSASEMHIQATEYYGTAWRSFIQNIIKADKTDIQNLHKKITVELENAHSAQSYSHINSISLAATADYLVSVWIFKDNKNSAYTRAVEMASEILNLQPSAREREVNSHAIDFIVEWFQSYDKHFADGGKYDEDYRDPLYGYTRDGHVLIFPKALEKALSDAGYSYKKTLKYLHEKQLIPEEKGICRTFFSKRIKVIDLDYEKIMREREDKQIDDFEGFVEIESDDDLPF